MPNQDIRVEGITLDDKAQEVLALCQEEDGRVRTNEIVSKTHHSAYVVRSRFERLEDAGLAIVSEESVNEEEEGAKKASKVLEITDKGRNFVESIGFVFDDGLSLAERIKRIERQQNDVLNRIDKLEHDLGTTIALIDGEKLGVPRSYWELMESVDDLETNVDRLNEFVTSQLRS